MEVWFYSALLWKINDLSAAASFIKNKKQKTKNYYRQKDTSRRDGPLLFLSLVLFGARQRVFALNIGGRQISNKRSDGPDLVTAAGCAVAPTAKAPDPSLPQSRLRPKTLAP